MPTASRFDICTSIRVQQQNLVVVKVYGPVAGGALPVLGKIDSVVKVRVERAIAADTIQNFGWNEVLVKNSRSAPFAAYATPESPHEQPDGVVIQYNS